MLPPTTYLPSIKSIATYPVDTLEDALRYLRLIYSPPVRGSRRRSALTATGTSKSEWREDDLATEELRNDTFERVYAIKWLSALIAQCGDEEEEEEGLTEATDCTKDTAQTPSPPTSTRRESLIENAASLLATCAGTASAGTLTRQFLFPVLEPDALPISIELTDAPLDNQDYGSVGAQTWGGACIMAEMIVEDPGAFGLPTRHLHEGELLPTTLRYLELGAGTGLVSLAASKVVERLGVAESASSKTRHIRPVHIVATDYYPSVLENLDRNVLSNFPKHSRGPDSQPIISTARLDWSTFCDAEAKEPIFQDPFEVIYGADIIYEALHATWIKSCLGKLLRKPTSAAEDPTFHLIIPLRATHAVESSTIEQVFPTHRIKNDVSPPHPLELVIKHKQIVICEAESGRQGEEVEYAYYRIGWGWS